MSYFGQELILASQLDASGFQPQLVNGSSFTTFYGIATERLPYPVGTSESLVVPYFHVQDDAPTNQSWQATVSGLSTDLQCETIRPINETKPQHIFWRSVLAEWYLADVRTPSCNISQVIVAKGLDNNPTSIPTLAQYQGWWGNYTCNDGIPADTYPGYRPVKAGPHEHVLLLTTSLMRWNQSQNYGRQEWVDEITMVMCRPSYQVKKYVVSFASDSDLEQPLSAQAAPGPVQPLAGLQPIDLISAAKIAASNANLGLNSQDNYDLQPLDELFHLMSIMKGQPKDSTNLSVFMDGDVLASYGKRAVTGVTTQVTHDAILRPVNETLAGSIQRSENRLQVETVSMALIITTLGFMCLFAVWETFISPQNVVPRDPRTLAAAATFLHSSEKLSFWLRSRLSDKNIERASFTSAVSKRFGIEGVAGPANTPVDKGSDHEEDVVDHVRWWKPSAFHLWFAVLAIGLPLVLVAVLQILQHVSDTDDGLFNLSKTVDTRLIVSYLTAAILMGTATLYGSLNAAIVFVAPLIPLKRGGAQAAKSLTLNLASDLAPHAFAQALRFGLFAAVFSIPGAFVASYLTTVGSTLFLVRAVPLTATVLLTAQDGFDLGYDLSQGDNLAGVTTNEIVYHDLTYPQWTYGNLAFPKVNLQTDRFSQSLSESLSDDAIVSTTVPAVRASLDCQMIDPSKTGYLGANVPGNTSSTLMFSGKLKPGFCTKTPGFKDVGGNNITQSFTVPVDGSNVTLGNAQMLHWWQQISKNDIREVTRIGGCPTFAFMLGTETALVTNNYHYDIKSDVHIYYCYQRLEQVMTKLTLDLHSLTINPINPPVPIESTARSLDYTYGSYHGPDFPFDLSNLTLGLSESGHSDADLLNLPTMDGFVEALVYSSIGHPMHELLADPQLALSSAQKLYGIYLAQAINANMRVPVASNAAASTSQTQYTSSLEDPSRQRIVQSSSIKWALQGILIFMSVCAIFAYFFSYRYSHELVKKYPSPGSIAGMMAPFAGSRFIRDETEGGLMTDTAEWENTREDVKRFQGEVFSLGWWETMGERRYGIDAGTSLTVNEK